MAGLTFLYVLRLIRPGVLDSGPEPEEKAILGRHLAYLSRLQEAGIVLVAGRTDSTGEATRGLCLLRTESLAEARAIAAADPAVAEGLMTVETFPFSIAVGGCGPA